ncbi:transmembrane amino acid transporter protein-domain-containing protein [Limtongia smithiae]|uniref:transmembrane amino acid transporter protein-domain-containing protein n=1 Tax=Limtongia smithiae TaxID=1125753 RepID=UPI0034CFA098
MPDAIEVQPRRGSIAQSFLHAGGVNSLDRFASSYTRAQAFLVLDAPLSLASQPAVFSLRQGVQSARESIPLLFRRSSSQRLLDSENADGSSAALNHAIAPADVDAAPESALAAPNALDLEDYDEDVEEYGNVEAEDTVAPLLHHADGVPSGGPTGRLLSPDVLGTVSTGVPVNTRRLSVAGSIESKKTDRLIGGGQRVLVDQFKGRVLVVPGRSTAPQTVFNSVNILIGIGLLSLPLAISYAGWIFGCFFMFAAAGITLYTAKVLARCLDTDPTLVTYADIAYAAFGARARLLTSLLFSLELLGACIALVVLFADSIATLLPNALSKTALKILAFFLLTPLSFLPLSVLSFSSIMGITSTFGILVIVFIDGLIKRTQPGTLWQPMPSTLLPENWKTLPLSLGLLMAPWCGHSVFPNVYRDMRHPYKFSRCLNISYVFTFVVDASMGILGLLMFGNQYVTDEITNTIIETPGFPRSLSITIIVLIAFIPLSKTPLNARPIITTMEVLCGVTDTPPPLDLELIDPRDEEGRSSSSDPFDIQIHQHPIRKLINFFKSRTVARALIRLGVNFVVVVIAIVFPAFDRIMALVGSALGFTICIVLPLAFYLRLFGPGGSKASTTYRISTTGRPSAPPVHVLSRLEIAFDIFAIVVGAILAIVGGIWALLPDELIFGTE